MARKLEIVTTSPDNNSSDASPCQGDTWETVPGPAFGGDSLEDQVWEGDKLERKQSKQGHHDWEARTTINACPELVASTIVFLKTKDRNLRTAAAVTRYATRAGIKVLEKVKPIQLLKQRRREAYLNRDELGRQRFIGHRFDFAHHLSQMKVHQICWSFRWVEGAISDMATEMGLPASTIAVLALCAGFGQSIEWVPGGYRDKFVGEVRRFQDYLLGRLKEL